MALTRWSEKRRDAQVVSFAGGQMSQHVGVKDFNADGEFFPPLSKHIRFSAKTGYPAAVAEVAEIPRLVKFTAAAFG
jgi:hypothetical protein